MLTKSPPFLTIPTADLKAAHKILKLVTERRTTIPILEHARYATKGGILTATATDLDREITVSMACAAGEGETLIPVHGLAKTIQNMGQGIATLAADGAEGYEIVSGALKVKKAVPAAADFPRLDVGEIEAQFTCDALELAWALERCAPSISTDETRYYLNGVYLHWTTHDGRTGMTAVATDGHRLTWCRMDTPKATITPKAPLALPAPAVKKAKKTKKGDPKAIAAKLVAEQAAREKPTGLESWSALIPSKSVHILVRLLEVVDDGSLVTVSRSGSRVVFECQNWRLVTKLIDGTFPDWQRVWPLDPGKSVTVDTAELEAAIERLKGVADERGRAARFTVSKGKLRLSLGGDQEGVVEEIDTLDIKGKVPEIGFNMDYIGNTAWLMHAATVRFEIHDGGSPARIIDPAQDEDMGHVLMPMRV